MCGIFAWVGPGFDEQRLKSCTDRLSHRGPDQRGIWTDGAAYLGHRRLSIIDLSPAGIQPMFNEDNTVAVIFNGEIYNFLELRPELEAKGHVFRSRSDTEVIIHAYEEYGDDCVQRFWGMFAFAIWDQKRKRMLVARDRFGKKPLNYVHRGQNLAIASEIPAILESGISERVADLDALRFFWQLEYIPAPMSAFTDIKKLPAGHAMVFENGRLRTWKYYPPREIAPFKGTYEQAKEQLQELLIDATRRRLISDVPVGIALSGGIDSAMVTLAARKLNPGRLVTVTVRPHLEDNEHDEGDYARATAKALGTEHHEIRPVPDFKESFETIIDHLGEPFAVGSAIPCFYLYSMLRSLATVVISGDGADELLGGYDHFHQANLAHTLRRFMPDPLLRAMYNGINGLYGLCPPLRRKLKYPMAGIQSLRGLALIDPRWEQKRALQPNILRHWSDTRPLFAFKRDIESQFNETEPVRRQMLGEQFDRMTYHILTKVDITSMAHSVEVRSPLLDHRIAEFGRSLPTEFLMKDGVGKRVLRDLGAGLLPAEVIGKRKTGFNIPIRDLFANELKGYLLERLTAAHPVYDALVNRASIPGIIDSHCAGQPYETLLILKLLALRLWIEKAQPRLPAIG